MTEFPFRDVASTRRRSLIAIATGVLLGCVALVRGSAQPTAPNVTFHTLADGPVPLAQLRGKVVLVNFWATTCAVCLREMPGMVELYRRYAPDGFEIIAVAMPSDGAWLVADYATSHALPFRAAHHGR